jgi:hypothetical protein
MEPITEATCPEGVCLSTHGGAGYAPGSYWRGTSIICGICGTEIKNPRPVGSRWVWIPDHSFLGRLLNRGRGYWAPKWPDWIGGEWPAGYLRG